MVRLLLVLVLLLMSVGCVAADLVPFVLPWDDASPGPTNISILINKPAGKYGFVKVKDSHLYEGSKRLRLFGVNITTSACFPQHSDAEKVAARLAKFGINCVRFHHMDAVWADDVILTKDKRQIDPTQLEKLDYFIYQLKKNGIYADINLHVSREYPDMPAWQGHPDFYKGVDLFYPPMVQKQQEYARELLTHRNPYTKTKYVDEPSVVCVEINNEDGLLYMWSSNGFESMPDPYASSFSELWRKWLTKKYTSDQKLQKAWAGDSQPVGPELLTNGSFEQDIQGWNLETHNDTKASLTVDSDERVGNFARVNVTKTDGTGWHVQLIHTGVVLKKDKYYTITFQAKADRKLGVSVGVQMAGDPWESVFYAAREVGTEWTEYRLIFKSDRNDKDMRLNMSDLGLQPAVWDFARFSMKEGAVYDLPVTNIADINYMKRGNIDSYGPAVKRDWLQFLWDTEADYWTGMDNYLKKELGCKPSVVGTAVGFSPATMQAKLDIVDSHSYWHHPEFPVRPWDSEEWLIRNVSMAGDPGSGTLGSLAAARVFGKPFTVTEYNHPAPNTYSSEAFLLLAAYAGLQDWDGIFVFSYQGSRDGWNTRKIGNFFDTDQHPTKMAAMPAASAMFLRGDVQPAKNALIVPLPNAVLMDIIARTGPWIGPGHIGLTGLEAMKSRIGQSTSNAQIKPIVKETATVVRSDTRQLVWDTLRRVVTVDTLRSKSFIGMTNGKSEKLGDVEVQVLSSIQNWAAITLTAMKGSSITDSGSVLLTATGYTENSGMKWKDEQHTSVGRNWGNAPSLVECIGAEIRIPSKKPVKVWALDERGQKGKQVPVKMQSGKAAFRIGQDYKTLWYEVERVK